MVLALAVIVTVDQLTKAWVVASIGDHPKHLIGDFLVLEVARNSGSAFSRFQGYTPVLAVLAIVIAAFVARAVRQATDGWTLVALGTGLGWRPRQSRRPAGAVSGIPARPRGRLDRGRLVAGLQRRRFVYHRRRDRVDRTDAPRARPDAGAMIDGPIPIPAALEGDRVDRALSFLTGWPRTAVQQLIDNGDVLLAGHAVSKSHRLHEGDVLEVLEEPPLDRDRRPEPDASVVVDVRYADDDVAVVAKPAGLVVHPGAGHATGTLVNGLLACFPGIADVGDPTRPGIVHRLDRDTSGLLAVAARRVGMSRSSPNSRTVRSSGCTSLSSGVIFRRRAA